jgi:murein DD-endopeptidase MepM/ murein hydrolase activator NlpD
MTHRSWPVLLPLFLAAVVGQSSLQAQTAMPQELPGHVSVPDVRLPGSEGSLARGALPAPGLDPAAPQGTVVLASRAGRVLLVESISGYGTTVLLDHGEGWQTLYAHLHEAIVVNGVWLEQGQPLGMVGMTGSATGPHLHFELRRQGAELLALDPTPHLPPPSLPPVLATISP